jgi:hypothetical protein
MRSYRLRLRLILGVAVAACAVAAIVPASAVAVAVAVAAACPVAGLPLTSRDQPALMFPIILRSALTCITEVSRISPSSRLSLSLRTVTAPSAATNS